MQRKHYDGLPKPEKVEVGQLWWHEGMTLERPFCVLEIRDQKGCSPSTCDKIVPWAVFRKKKMQPCGDMLTNPRWRFVRAAA